MIVNRPEDNRTIKTSTPNLLPTKVVENSVTKIPLEFCVQIWDKNKGGMIMSFRVDIWENGELIKREHFDNLKDAKSFQDLWNGYQRILGVPWIALLITGIEVFREPKEEEVS